MAPVEPPLIAITGPTASGKTSVAIELARAYGGEIICADSRTIYKDMNIGTAKPTIDEQQGVPHWGIDMVEPGERYSAFDFQQYAFQKIAEIRHRGNIPMLVGGTGLYIDAVLFSYTFNDSVKNTSPQRPLNNSFIVGIATKKQAALQMMRTRAEHMLTNGLEEEATMLGKKYGAGAPQFKNNAYQIVMSNTSKVNDIESTVDKIATFDIQLRKRQLTWFRRNPYIAWATKDDAPGFIASHIEQYRATIEHESYPGDI